MDTEADCIACETGVAPWLDQHGRHMHRGEWDAKSIPSTAACATDPPNDLEPCPWCGVTPLRVQVERDVQRVACHRCHARGPDRRHRVDAVREWNWMAKRMTERD